MRADHRIEHLYEHLFCSLVVSHATYDFNDLLMHLIFFPAGF